MTPNQVVTAARTVLVAGAISVAVLTLGPYQGLEQVFGLSDKTAHAIAFGALLAVSFIAFPRMRRSDLAIAAVMLGASVEVAQIFTPDRSASLGDLAADAIGVCVIHFTSQIESLRALARQRGGASFSDILAQDRRRGARRLAPIAKAVFSPSKRATQAEQPVGFASRASRHFASGRRA